MSDDQDVSGLSEAEQDLNEARAALVQANARILELVRALTEEREAHASSRRTIGGLDEVLRQGMQAKQERTALELRVVDLKKLADHERNQARAEIERLLARVRLLEHITSTLAATALQALERADRWATCREDTLATITALHRAQDEIRKERDQARELCAERRAEVAALKTRIYELEAGLIDAPGLGWP